MINLKNNVKIAAITICMLQSFCAYAENVVTDVGKSISNAATQAGTAVKSAGQSIGVAASDTAITTKVKALLALESDIPLNISVSTTNGVVTLDGEVDTKLQANKIVEIASGVDGVKSVDQDKLKTASSDSYISDMATTLKAKSRIMQLSHNDKIASGYDLHVETTNGVVHIFGTVANEADINTVKESINTLSGVNDVKVNIDVKK